ncbi:MAG: LysR family transcriptional regulator [Clostridia bacterium]|nr:LysR family transcriptional regulator [Clostridia bacterium]
MELSHLQTFLLLAKSGSFSQTAAVLHLTQPAVSQQIRTLEEELGQVLFVRRSRSNPLTKLTPAGELFLPYARQITLFLAEGRELLKNHEPKKLTSLSFAAGSTTISYHLPELVRAYRRQAPAGEFIIKTGSSQEVAELVLKGEVDFGFVNTPAHTGNLKCFPLFREEILLVVPCEWEPPAMPLRVPDLAKEVLILPTPRSGFRDFLNESFRRHRLAPRILLELDDLEGIKEMVRIGLGVSFLPESAVRSGLASGALKTCPLEEEFSCPTFLLSLPERFWTRAMREFAGLLQEKFEPSGLVAHSRARVQANENTYAYERIHTPVNTPVHEDAPAYTTQYPHTPTYTHGHGNAGAKEPARTILGLIQDR